MRHIMFSPVARVAVPNFPTLSHNRRDFRKKIIEHKIVFSFALQILYKKFSY